MFWTAAGTTLLPVLVVPPSIILAISQAGCHSAGMRASTLLRDDMHWTGRLTRPMSCYRRCARNIGEVRRSVFHYTQYSSLVCFGLFPRLAHIFLLPVGLDQDITEHSAHTLCDSLAALSERHPPHLYYVIGHLHRILELAWGEVRAVFSSPPYPCLACIIVNAFHMLCDCNTHYFTRRATTSRFASLPGQRNVDDGWTEHGCRSS